MLNLITVLHSRNEKKTERAKEESVFFIQDLLVRTNKRTGYQHNARIHSFIYPPAAEAAFLFFLSPRSELWSGSLATALTSINLMAVT